MNPIVQACLERGSYTLSAGTLEPAIVLQRLLDALRVLDSDAHRAFVADPLHRQFAGDLSLHRTAQLVAQGRGERGRNVDYISSTIAHMHELGLSDPHLDRILLAVLALQGRRRAS